VLAALGEAALWRPRVSFVPGKAGDAGSQQDRGSGEREEEAGSGRGAIHQWTHGRSARLETLGHAQPAATARVSVRLARKPATIAMHTGSHQYSAVAMNRPIG
jgi:hypothetical protein